MAGIMHGTSSLELGRLLEFKHRKPNGRMGWGPAMRARYGYFSPEDHYEHLLMNLVTSQTQWLDIGAGDGLCASGRISRLLAERCALLVGVDPSVSIWRNPYLHRRYQQPLEQFHPRESFDLLTLRMVAEHVQDPAGFVSSLVRLARPGGRIVVYTVHRFSPMSLLARLAPFKTRSLAKRWLWGSPEEDTFPVFYRMNTPAALRTLFGRAGCVERGCWLLDDCRTLARFWWGLWAELTAWSWLRRVGLGYPERCLIAMFSVPSPHPHRFRFS